MILVNINIRNPFKHQPYRNIWCKSWGITKNKTLEIQFYSYAYNLFETTLDLNLSGSSHAGPRFEFGVFGWNAIIQLHDNRHWDYENNCWEKATSD
jgi:hypothetical protein